MDGCADNIFAVCRRAYAAVSEPADPGINILVGLAAQSRSGGQLLPVLLHMEAEPLCEEWGFCVKQTPCILGGIYNT